MPNLVGKNSSSMMGQERKVKTPCNRCRKLHLKCVWEGSSSRSSCSRCEKSGHDCVSGKKRTKFRNIIFTADSEGNIGVQKDLLGKASVSIDEADTPGESLSQDQTSELTCETTQELPNRMVSQWKQASMSLPMSAPASIDDRSVKPPLYPADQDHLRGKFSTRHFDLSENITSQDKSYLEYILIRYFHEELAPFCDWCDPDCHFATVVPRRIRDPGPLRSAVLTFAARHMSRNVRARNLAREMEWKGRVVPDPKKESAMLYHNECIRDLLSMSMDPEKLQDETLLAAVIVLRTDEEMGFDTDGEQEDQQIFLKIANVIIGAQLPRTLRLPHSPGRLSDFASPNSDSLAGSNLEEGDFQAAGLREACIWTALRQDLHAAMLTQQPVNFPLTRCEAFRNYSPAPDGVWANRMVTLCADVAEFAFGSESSECRVMPAYNDEERWLELHNREVKLTRSLPESFEPSYYNERSLLHNVFPEIWYSNHWVICGVTYIELARLLLELFNPHRPQLGHLGFKNALKASISAAKKILLRLCGVALTNDHCSPSLINACLGISLVGEHSDDPLERRGLLDVLDLMYDRHAYEALSNKIATSLKELWTGEQ